VRTAFDISLLSQGDINVAVDIALAAGLSLQDGFEVLPVEPINRLALKQDRRLATFGTVPAFDDADLDYTNTGNGDNEVYVLPPPAQPYFTVDPAQTAFDLALVLYGDMEKAVDVALSGFGRLDLPGGGASVPVPTLETVNDIYRGLIGKKVVTGLTQLTDASASTGGAFSNGFDRAAFE